MKMLLPWLMGVTIVTWSVLGIVILLVMCVFMLQVGKNLGFLDTSLTFHSVSAIPEFYYIALNGGITEKRYVTIYSN